MTQSIMSYPNQIDVTSFTHKVVKFLIPGTLVASWGISNITSPSPVIEWGQVMKSHFNGRIELTNGDEVEIVHSSPTIEDSHHLTGDDIEYNEVKNIILWTDMSKEAIDLKLQYPSFVKNESMLNGNVIVKGLFQPTLDENFDEVMWSELEDSIKFIKVENQIESEIVYGGTLQFPQLD
ncbi:hypothetical protein [Metabacillus litoralis]|uniref:hypothetical protein n=1 Tax=Metabacillus litoralis TaxID=152268 RepID=UPI00203DCC52|nr:hypothetical protein [Metabacillus litoralis]MCM3651347.1 hypothetical protein [Metabacillus litoralis]